MNTLSSQSENLFDAEIGRELRRFSSDFFLALILFIVMFAVAASIHGYMNGELIIEETPERFFVIMTFGFAVVIPMYWLFGSRDPKKRSAALLYQEIQALRASGNCGVPHDIVDDIEYLASTCFRTPELLRRKSGIRIGRFLDAIRAMEETVVACDGDAEAAALREKAVSALRRDVDDAISVVTTDPDVAAARERLARLVEEETSASA